MQAVGEEQFIEDTSDQDALDNPDFTKAKLLGAALLCKLPTCFQRQPMASLRIFEDIPASGSSHWRKTLALP